MAHNRLSRKARPAHAAGPGEPPRNTTNPFWRNRIPGRRFSSPTTWLPLTSSPWSREKLNGGDLLLRVLDSEPNRDAEHRVPAESGFQPKQIFSQVCSSRWSEGSRIESPRWHCCNVIEKLQLADIASWRNEGQPKDCVFQSDGLYTGCSFDNRD